MNRSSSEISSFERQFVKVFALNGVTFTCIVDVGNTPGYSSEI